MTYKDDLDIIKAAEGDTNKLSLNAITELDNKGLLNTYGAGGSMELKTTSVQLYRDMSLAPRVAFVKFTGTESAKRLLPEVITMTGTAPYAYASSAIIGSMMITLDNSMIFQETGTQYAEVTEDSVFHIVQGSSPK